MRVWEGGVYRPYMMLRNPVCCLLHDHIKGYCHHRRDDINSSHQHLIISFSKKALHWLYQFRVFTQLTPRLLWRHTTSIQRNVFSVASLRSNAISLWSKYPHRLALSPVKMTFRKSHFACVTWSPSLMQGGIILLVKWSFRQCGPVSVRVAFGERRFERLYKWVVLSGLVVLSSSSSSSCSPNSKKGRELGRYKERTTQLLLQITCVRLSFWSLKHMKSCHMTSKEDFIFRDLKPQQDPMMV